MKPLRQRITRGIAVAFCLVLLSCAANPTVQITEQALGDGESAQRHSRVTIHYSGWLADGTMFDTTRTDGIPQTFTINGGDIIAGLEQGIVGMKSGGRREIVIPPALAYGAKGLSGHIPPNATLRFDVEVVAVTPPRYKNISVDELAKQRGELVLIDIRTPEEWAETGVVSGSILLTAFGKDGKFVREFPLIMNDLVDGNKNVAFICRSGNRSSELARVIAEEGRYKNVYNVVGGIKAWRSAGGAVTFDSVRPLN
ncbi:FKBP-type peptidyl-prolyl cis-trans isomerase [Magnetospirillum sp. 64-120]|uniref:FKBP-type peptidyl-prolyl cis-trans isomerase n=1 Tax=Magnetospirillum sp. 64-120 TaxID=1895778 RepID=UPI0025BD79C5|nr:FKBP-type peptidyl-prolyl cis-trans isomerase [Magnetospirillum sp. 64-120]